MAPLTSHFHTTTNGTQLHYLQGGSPQGQLLIALHGLDGSTTTFTPPLPYLQRDIDTYNIVLVDFPGFGNSPLLPAPPKLFITGYVADIHDLVTHLQALGKQTISQPILLGHSLGGIIALHYTSVHPNTIAGFALFSPGCSVSHTPPVRQRMLDLAASARERGIAAAAAYTAAHQSNFPPDNILPVDPALRRAVYEAVASSDPEGYAPACEAIVDLTHVDPDYSKIMCPALFVVGDLDTISMPDRIQALSELLGHQPILENLMNVAKLLSDFLKRLA